MLKRTHIYEFHREKGKLTEFAGFEHALWYEGIIPEHLSVRNSVGIFDVTHMGRCVVKGVESVKLLNHVLARDVSAMNVNQGRYTVMLNEKGGIIDDLTVFRLEKEKFLVVYNAGNREKDFKWLMRNSSKFNVDIKDVSDEVVMFAVQGPRAFDTLQSISRGDLSTIKRYWLGWTKLDDFKVMLTRSGYTGEDGFEVYLWDTPLEEADKALELWNRILKAGKKFGIKPCGLGARDTLRLEAGMCLYGHDINEETTPLEANLEFTVSFGKEEFIGKEALVKQKERGVERIRVGLKLMEGGVPREGYEIYSNDEKIGYVTSGTFSPLLRCGIAMGYVKEEKSTVGESIQVNIRNRRVKARIVNMPFYDVEKYGWRRRI